MARRPWWRPGVGAPARSPDAIHTGALTPWPAAELAAPGPPGCGGLQALSPQLNWLLYRLPLLSAWTAFVADSFQSAHHTIQPSLVNGKWCKNSNTLQPFCSSQRGQLEGGARFTGMTFGDRLNALHVQLVLYWTLGVSIKATAGRKYSLSPLGVWEEQSDCRKGIRLCRSLTGLINTTGLQGEGINKFWRNKTGFLLRNGLSPKNNTDGECL